MPGKVAVMPGMRCGKYDFQQVSERIYRTYDEFGKRATGRTEIKPPDSLCRKRIRDPTTSLTVKPQTKPTENELLLETNKFEKKKIAPRTRERRTRSICRICRDIYDPACRTRTDRFTRRENTLKADKWSWKDEFN